jgi:D-alanine-D-alanine ligase
MAEAYLPLAPVHRADPAQEAATIGEVLGYPCFLKTDLSGSSLGVTRAEGPDQVVRFLGEARGLGRRFLAERLVAGEEISVPVLGNSGDDPQALPPIGIYPRTDSFFTHAAKYDAAACEEVVPPRGLDAAQIDEVQRLAVLCH